MQIPDVPTVPMDLDDNTKDFLDSLEGRLDKIKAVRVFNDKVHVLGTYLGYIDAHYCEIIIDRTTGRESKTSFKTPDSFDGAVGTLFTLGLYHICVTEVRKDRIRKYKQTVREYIHANLAEAEERVKDVRVFQGTVDEVSRELGRPLERVETSRPETFMRASDTLNLRIQAYLMGANAVVHYQPGSAMGTPVRYADKK